MSDKTEKPDDEGGWVPSAEHPVPPTTEFQAVAPDAVEPISGSAEPDEAPEAPAADDPATAPTPEDPDVVPGAGADAPDDAVPASPSVTTVAPDADEPALASPASATSTGGDAPATETPAWKTPPAAGLPPQWGDPDAQATGPQPTNQASNLWGLAPDDRPEVLLGAALAGGVLAAIVLRTLARR